MSTSIVVTGAGVLSSIGAGVAEFEKALYAGKSGVGPSQLLDGRAIAAEVRDFSPQHWLGNKGIRVLDRTARLLCVAAHLALCEAGFARSDSTDGDPELGLVCGTMFGSVHSIASFDWGGLVDGPNYVNPMDFPNTVINSAAGQAAIKFKLGGINSTICGGLASGLYALHYAAEFLRLGRARTLLAGGAEEFSEESFLGFQKTGILSPSGLPRPFGADRDGLILGEGSALLVLESEETARARGTKPWVEVSGFGCAQDAHSTREYQVRAEGATSAIQMALESAGTGPDAVACIISGASGSRTGDEMEARALRNVFGPRLAEIPACAPKAALGECLGVSGAMGALVGALALVQQCVPPTAHLQEAADGIRLANQSQGIQGEFALVNAFGCDGNNAAMVLRRWIE